MTVQTVPYALQNASHSAALFRQSASAPFTTGGVLGATELAVTQQSTPNMSVILGAGRAKVPGNSVSPPAGFTWTTQAMYDVLNDAPLTLTVSASNPTNPRIDAAYVQVQDSFYSGASNTALAGIVTGAPAASPTAPAIPTNATLVAYIAVAANATTIVNANITSQTVLASLIASPAIGSTRVIPTGTTGSIGGTTQIGPNGVVTFSGATTVKIVGCFSATYDYYRIEFDITTTAGVDIVPSLGASVTGYDRSFGGNANSSFSGGTSLNAAGWGLIAAGIAGETAGWFELYNPARAVATTGTAQSGTTANPMVAANSGVRVQFWQHDPLTAFNDLVLTVSSGSMSGTIRIFGYNNN